MLQVILIGIYLFSVFLFEQVIKDYTNQWQSIRWYNKLFGIVYGPLALGYLIFVGVQSIYNHTDHPFWWDCDSEFINIIRILSMMRRRK